LARALQAVAEKENSDSSESAAELAVVSED
jgi:hypothetical protein